MATETATPPPVTPSAQAIPDIPVQNRPRVSNKIMEAARGVRQEFEKQNDGKRERIEARKNPPVAEPEKKTEGAESVKPPVVPPVVAAPPENPVQDGIKTNLAGDKETNMAALRKAREDAEARATSLEKQLAETQARIPTDYEQLRKDRELLISEIEKRDVTASPRFKEKYDKPMEQQLGQIKKTLTLTDVKPDDFLVVVQMPESKERNAKLGELLEGLDPISSGKVQTALSQYDNIRDQRSADMLDPKASWQENAREMQVRQAQAAEKQKAVIEGAITKAKTQIPWFKPVEGNETWNKKIAETEERARGFWNGGHSPDELAELTMAGTLAPLFSETIALLHSENEKLNDELASLRGSKPKVAAGTSASAPPGGKGKYEGFGNLGAMVRAKAMGKS